MTKLSLESDGERTRSHKAGAGKGGRRGGAGRATHMQRDGVEAQRGKTQSRCLGLAACSGMLDFLHIQGVQGVAPCKAAHGLVWSFLTHPQKS